MACSINSSVIGSGGFIHTSDSSGELQLQTADTTAVSIDANQGVTFAHNINAPDNFGFRNRLINGNFSVAQRTTSAVTVTPGTAVPTISTGYTNVDRWYVYSTGGNAIVSRYAGIYNSAYYLSIAGSGTVASIGIGQRIEAINCADMEGKKATISADLVNSLLTTVTWSVYTLSTTVDTYGTVGTPTKTLVATGTWTVTTSFTRYSATMDIPNVPDLLGLEVVFTVGAQVSGSFSIGNVQFEKGDVATPYEVRDYGTELARCERYCELAGGGSLGIQSSTAAVGAAGQWDLGATYRTLKRAQPILSINGSPTITLVFVPGNIQTIVSPSAWTLSVSNLSSWRVRVLVPVVYNNSTAGTMIYGVQTADWLLAQAEII